MSSLLVNVPKLGEIRGMMTPNGPQYFLIITPDNGPLLGKVIVWGLAINTAEVIDPNTEEGNEVLTKVRAMPPMTITMSSEDDFPVPQPMPEKEQPEKEKEKEKVPTIVPARTMPANLRRKVR